MNIMNCTNPELTAFPSVPPFTDWLIMRNVNMSILCTNFTNIGWEKGMMSNLNIESSNLGHICDRTLEVMLSSKRLKELSFLNNNLTEISQIWKTHSSHLEKVWLSGNPIDCHCDMLWTMNWLENATGASGHRLVQDYKDVICATGSQTGTPVYKLNRVTMGCYPKHIPIWIIIIGCSVSGFILCIVVSILIIHRHRRLVRWLIYKNFDKLLGNPDRNEDITEKQFDAFISFRSETLI